jgi:sugar phosphate isomerase/epimerase
MRLGGNLTGKYRNADEWLRGALDIGYKAVSFPLQPGADRSETGEYVAAMRENDIVNAEVGAWSNPLSADPAERETAMRKNIAALEYAEETGALCCVNIAGARGAAWDGPHRSNLSDETFDMIVKNTQTIIDAVKPKNTKYSLETMPWIFPDSPESYLRLSEAINRSAFGVHLDICNMINCPERYFGITEFIDKCFDLLGSQMLSLHLKDIKISDRLTLHLDEALPGLGAMDFARIFARAARLDRNTPMIIEHLPDNEAYAAAYRNLRAIITAAGLDADLV